MWFGWRGSVKQESSGVTRVVTHVLLCHVVLGLLVDIDLNLLWLNQLRVMFLQLAPLMHPAVSDVELI
jgi:hypothetical protein